ncbi:MAG: DUF481 domain-containing protein [bacterium]|nr:DUF481 domain-containing protein [bacterium]
MNDGVLAEGRLLRKHPRVARTLQIVGEVTIPAKDLQAFVTDAPIVIHLRDGSVVKQQVSASEPGQFAIQQGAILGPQVLQLMDVVSINPPEKEPAKWTGHIAAGFTLTQGNSDSEAANLNIGLQRRSEIDRITFDASYLFGRSKDDDGKRNTTHDEWSAGLQYDYFLRPKLYIYSHTRVQRDRVADLDLRLLVGVGGGYQWIETPAISFSTEAGPKAS